jgi:hypothetical protein
MWFHALLKIVLKVSNPLYIESHRIPIKAGADPFAVHIGAIMPGEVMLGFWFGTQNLARNLINILRGRYQNVLTIK